MEDEYISGKRTNATQHIPVSLCKSAGNNVIARRRRSGCLCRSFTFILSTFVGHDELSSHFQGHSYEKRRIPEFKYSWKDTFCGKFVNNIKTEVANSPESWLTVDHVVVVAMVEVFSAQIPNQTHFPCKWPRATGVPLSVPFTTISRYDVRDMWKAERRHFISSLFPLPPTSLSSIFFVLEAFLGVG